MQQIDWIPNFDGYYVPPYVCINSNKIPKATGRGNHKEPVEKTKKQDYRRYEYDVYKCGEFIGSFRGLAKTAEVTGFTTSYLSRIRKRETRRDDYTIIKVELEQVCQVWLGDKLIGEGKSFSDISDEMGAGKNTYYNERYTRVKEIRRKEC